MSIPVVVPVVQRLQVAASPLWPWRACGLGLAFTALLAAAPPAPAPIDHLVLLGRIPAAQRDLEHPIALEVRVNHVDSAWKILWVQSEENTGFFPLADRSPELRIGQRVRLEGGYVPAEGLSRERVKVSVLAEDEPIEPLDATGQIGDVTAFDQRVVVAEGYVETQQLIDPSHLRLSLVINGHRVFCTVPPAQPGVVPAWRGLWVRVRGLYATGPGPDGRPAIQLWAGRQSDVAPLDDQLRPPPAVGALAKTPDAATKLISSPGQVWGLATEEKSLRHPLRIEGRVNHVDADWRLLWLDCDGTPGFMHLAVDAPPLVAGQQVLLEGTLIPSVGLAAQDVQVTVLADYVPIAPLSSTGRVGEIGAFDQRVVLMEGYVDAQRVMDPLHERLSLIVENRPVVAWLPSSPENPLPNLRGRFVRLQGVYSGRPDPTGAETSIELWVSRQSDVVVKGSIASDPRFERPATPVSEIHRLPPGSEVRVRGRLQRRDLGRSLLVHDGTGAMEVYSVQVERLPIGSEVEAIGRIALDGMRWIVRDGLYRRSRDGTPELERPDPLQPLRTVQRVRELTHEEAALGRPVQVKGVVTWSSPAADFFFVQDASGGIRVHFDRQALAAPATQKHVSVQGISRAGGLGPAVEARQLEVLGAMGAPQPKLVTLDQAITGAEDGQWVEIRGFLRDNQLRAGGRWLSVATPFGEYFAHLNDVVGYVAQTGALLRVHGVCEAQADEQGQVGSVLLRVPFAQNILVEEDAPTDTFDLPLRSVRSLRQLSAVQDMSRVRVAGTVLHHVPGRYLYLLDGDAGLMILSRATDQLQAGDRIEAAGILGWEGVRTVLREAVVQRTGRGVPPEPVTLADGDQLSPYYDARLVRIEAALIDLSQRPERVQLTLQSGQAVFEATLDGGERLLEAAGVAVGAKLRLTGIYRVGFDDVRHTRGFELQLRRPADVLVLQRARFWTASRALGACLVFAGLTLSGVAWATSLRRRVRRQTEQMRRQLEKEVALEDRHRGIVEHASDCIFTTDLAGRITSFNPAGERMTGCPREEAIGMSLLELFAPGDHSAPPVLLPEGDGTVTFQHQLRTRDGRLIWIETSTRLIGDRERAAGVLGIVRDISERKQIEEELKRARDAAEMNTRAKSEFLANMSHEIRTPMNAVIGMTNLLLESPLNEQQRDFADTIRNGAEALLAVLNDILDFSKIEAGRLHLELLDFDVREVVDGTIELIAARAAAKRLELAAFLPADLTGKVRGDPSRLRQVLLNLLGNAIKFTEHGDVVLSVHLSEETADQVEVRFEVADTGIGLSPEQQERLFRPFSQADTSTTRRFGGTGLGLAIAKQIVELMHGRCGVRSTPGQGSTFWFTARFQKPDTPVDATRAAPPQPLRGVRTLIVDDSATGCRLLQHYANAWGMPNEAARTGATALASLRGAAEAGAPFDLVLLDAEMPEMDGLQLAREIRADPRLSRVRLVLISSFDRQVHGTELAELEIGAVIRKPVRQVDLLTSMAHAWGEERARPAAPASVRRTRPPIPVAESDPPAEARAPLRVLVAEDNVVNQRVAALQLKNLGHVVEVAANGFEVLEAVERSPFDLILMDCQMPEMDGYEATRRLRQQPRHAQVPIIALTANAMQGDREKCLGAGMSDYLAKPMRLRDLQAALARIPRASVPAASSVT